MTSTDEMLEVAKRRREAKRWVLRKAEEEGSTDDQARIRSLFRRWWRDQARREAER